MKQFLLSLLFALSALTASAWPGMTMRPLHVQGRQLVDEAGNVVLLHGMGQTYSPWFNEKGAHWSNYDVAKCLDYNQGLLRTILYERGWKFNWLRLHMDPYWSNTPGIPVRGEHEIHAFSADRFVQYLRQVFIPMARAACEMGMYVVMRPPGVCPHTITPGDDYNRYLVQVWQIVAKELATVEANADIAPFIMFELANEPVRVEGSITAYFQAVVDAIRKEGFAGVLWVPGAGYQSHYDAYACNPIRDANYGYAFHCYPGWFGSDCYDRTPEQVEFERSRDFAGFHADFARNVGCVAKTHPVMLTEMDWASHQMGCSWGKAWTGVRGKAGFGANLKYIMDLYDNISWMLFTGAELLAQYDDNAPDGGDFLTSPEACVRPIYRWFKDYAPEWPLGKKGKAGRLASITFNNGEPFEGKVGQRLAAPVDGTYADGHTVCINPRCTFEMENTQIATYKDGLISLLDKGQTTLTVIAPNGKKERFAIGVQ